DGPGGTIAAAVLLLIATLDRASSRVSNAALVGVSALLAALPWLHTRFAVLGAGLGLVVIWRLVGAGNHGWRRAGVFSIVPLLSVAGWLAYFHMIYGTPNPAMAYGLDSGARLAYVPGGVFALL